MQLHPSFPVTQFLTEIASLLKGPCEQRAMEERGILTLYCIRANDLHVLLTTARPQSRIGIRVKWEDYELISPDMTEDRSRRGCWAGAVLFDHVLPLTFRDV